LVIWFIPIVGAILVLAIVKPAPSKRFTIDLADRDGNVGENYHNRSAATREQESSEAD
jgi:hypothetical protein